VELLALMFQQGRFTIDVAVVVPLGTELLGSAEALRAEQSPPGGASRPNKLLDLAGTGPARRQEAGE
jgi:hypothetical protein